MGRLFPAVLTYTIDKVFLHAKVENILHTMFIFSRSQQDRSQKMETY